MKMYFIIIINSIQLIQSCVNFTVAQTSLGMARPDLNRLATRARMLPWRRSGPIGHLLFQNETGFSIPQTGPKPGAAFNY